VFVSWIWALFSCVCLCSMSSLLMCLSLEYELSSHVFVSWVWTLFSCVCLCHTQETNTWEESSYSRDKHMRRELILKRQTHEKRAHIQETNTWEESMSSLLMCLSLEYELSSNVFVSWIWALFSFVFSNMYYVLWHSIKYFLNKQKITYRYSIMHDWWIFIIDVILVTYIVTSFHYMLVDTYFNIIKTNFNKYLYL
jgi:hypothetical protein